MLELGLLIYFIQTTAFSYFFTFFLKGEHKIRTFILLQIIFNVVMGPVASLLNNSYFVIPSISPFVSYLKRRVSFVVYGLPFYGSVSCFSVSSFYWSF